MAVTRTVFHQHKKPALHFLIREILTSSSFLCLNKAVLRKYGPVTAVVLSNLVEKEKYFEEHSLEGNGWFYHRNAEQLEELGVSEYALVQAKKELIREGILQVKMKGQPAKEWFRINYIVLAEGIGIDLDFSAPLDPEGLAPLDSMRLAPAKSEGLILLRNINKKQNKNIFPPEGLGVYFSIAEKLSQAIQSRKNIRHTPSQVTNWAKAIKKLAETSLTDDTEQAIKRIQKAVDWYTLHIGEQYVPVIESGSSLSEKFFKLESAMERETETTSPARKGITNGKFSGIKKLRMEELE